MADRFHRPQRDISEINVQSSYVLIDSPSFNRPESISLETVGKALRIKINDDVLKNINVLSSTYRDLEKDMYVSPQSLHLSPKLYLSTDEKYLYVWAEKSGRWKRVPLSDWDSPKDSSLH